MDKESKKSPMSRRKFLQNAGTALAGVSILAIFGGLIPRTNWNNSDYFWQIDPHKCTQCGKCETNCVLAVSAVKCVHSYKLCGYCDLCGAYYRKNVKTLNTAAENQLCPVGALNRKFIEEPYFEYTVNEDLCNGCAKCVKGCTSYGNGSLYLQIKRDLCKDCNECKIAINCPSNAISRVGFGSPYLLKR